MGNKNCFSKICYVDSPWCLLWTGKIHQWLKPKPSFMLIEDGVGWAESFFFFFLTSKLSSAQNNFYARMAYLGWHILISYSLSAFEKTSRPKLHLLPIRVINTKTNYWHGQCKFMGWDDHECVETLWEHVGKSVMKAGFLFHVYSNHLCDLAKSCQPILTCLVIVLELVVNIEFILIVNITFLEFLYV